MKPDEIKKAAIHAQLMGDAREKAFWRGLLDGSRKPDRKTARHAANYIRKHVRADS